MSKEEFLNLHQLTNYVIRLGVVDGRSKKRKDIDGSGVTNADLMFIHENGSPANNIPARPVLQMTIDETKKEWLDDALDKAVDKYLKSGKVEDFEKEMKSLCMDMQEYARDIIYSNDGRLAPNAERTAIAKGMKALKSREVKKEYTAAKDKDAFLYNAGNHPLFDTGQLARSIVCILEKEK